jgi:hypothetical protein
MKAVPGVRALEKSLWNSLANFGDTPSTQLVNRGPSEARSPASL